MQAHLQRFGFVGLTERFDESIVMMKHFLGWRKLRYFVRKQTRDRPSMDKVDPASLQLIRECNKFDLELYEFAQELFQRQIDELQARAGISIAQEYDDFKNNKLQLI